MGKNKFSKNELVVTKYFLRQLKQNNVPSYQDLHKYIKKRKINFGNFVETQKTLQKIRNNIIDTAVYSRVKPIEAFQTVTKDDLGLISADFGYYKKKFAKINKNYEGFFMAVSVAAQKRCGVLMKSRKTSSFEQAMEEICLGNIFPAVTTIISDRERAIFSDNFQKKMKEKYNINIHFIHRLNKAWSAENSIRWTKQDLTSVCSNKMTDKWIDILPEVIATHNRKKIKHTSYSPNDINDKNFLDFLNQKNKTNDITMLYNTNSISFESIPKGKWREKAFKFDIGDKVLATYKSLKGTKAFFKPSVEGNYSKKPYIIKRGFLRQTKNSELVPGNNILIYIYIYI